MKQWLTFGRLLWNLGPWGGTFITLAWMSLWEAEVAYSTVGKSHLWHQHLFYYSWRFLSFPAKLKFGKWVGVISNRLPKKIVYSGEWKIQNNNNNQKRKKNPFCTHCPLTALVKTSRVAVWQYSRAPFQKGALWPPRQWYSLSDHTVNLSSFSLSPILLVGFGHLLGTRHCACPRGASSLPGEAGHIRKCLRKEGEGAQRKGSSVRGRQGRMLKDWCLDWVVMNG